MGLLSSFWAWGYGLFAYIIPFLFVLTIVVFFHELGHFLVARWCGIKVLTFSIGFGPELAGFNDRHLRRTVCDHRQAVDGGPGRHDRRGQRGGRGWLQAGRRRAVDRRARDRK